MKNYNEKSQLDETKEFHDKYSTLTNHENTYTEKVVNTDLEYAPSKRQTWEAYAIEVRIYQKTGLKTSDRFHINTPKGPWYTHKSAGNCFMCSDQNFILVLCDVIEHMASLYPKQKF